MSYAQAIESLYARGHELAQAASSAVTGTSPRKFDLAEMRILTAALGSPELKFPSVLIAGTNGKGSTAAMLANILRVAGYRAGLYTSPHLTRVNERVQINGATISDDDFARLYFRVDETGSRLLSEGKLPQHPSFFESVTAVALLYFAEQAVDIAVLEVGMGGRLDATNIVEPLLSVITDISLDHTEWLGETIDAIAREKAGILRPNGILVTLPQHPAANQALGEVAVELNVRGVSAVEFMPPRRSAEEEATEFYSEPYSVTVAGTSVELRPALAGTHQHRNAALAVAAAIELCNSNSYNIITAADCGRNSHCALAWPAGIVSSHRHSSGRSAGCCPQSCRGLDLAFRPEHLAWISHATSDPANFVVRMPAREGSRGDGADPLPSLRSRHFDSGEFAAHRIAGGSCRRSLEPLELRQRRPLRLLPEWNWRRQKLRPTA